MKSYSTDSIFIDTFCNDVSFEQLLKSYDDYKLVLNQIIERNSSKDDLGDDDEQYATPIQEKVKPNIARFLNLNNYFVESVDKYEYLINSQKLITWFKKYQNKKCEEEYKKAICDIIKEYLAIVGNCYGQERKAIIAVLLFEILITKLGHDLIEKHYAFRKAVHSKIDEFKTESHTQFREHFTKNFESGKKYILIEKNKKYRRTLMRNYLLGLTRFISLQKRAKTNIDRRHKNLTFMVFCISSIHLLILFYLFTRFV